MEKKNIFGMAAEEIAAEFRRFGVEKYRARQVAEWIYGKGATRFEDMTNLPKKLRETLGKTFTVERAVCLKELTSNDGATTKFLLRVANDTAIESVLMRHDYGCSVCVSTQDGCAMGCRFCASTLGGFRRNLTAGEILAQVVFINDALKKENKKIDTIVVMGMGEPLANYDNTLKFLRLAHEDYALNIGYRNITVSTSGITDKIYRLAEENIPLNLAISLHAPYDELRSSIMPINKKYPLAEVVAAGKYYGDKTKRRVTYEYSLIDGVNDGTEAAAELAKLIDGQLAAVNLIPVNNVEEHGFRAPSKEKIKRFCDCLEKRKITVTVRREMGADVNAACGQLRGKHEQKK